MATRVEFYHGPSGRIFPGRTVNLSSGGVLMHIPAGIPVQIGQPIRLAVGCVNRPEFAGLSERPVDATVVRVDYRKGAFLDARRPEAAERNEAATIVLLRREGEPPLVVRQVAGLIARRIVTDVRPGERVARGRRIGMIKFSSRLELLVPKETLGNVLVDIGQTVRAGETPLAAPAGEADDAASAGD
jgi:hypothetical protein